MTALLSTAYWPNLHYFFYVLRSENLCIEQYDHYQKQSYRNRARILSANGVMDLSVPIKKNAPKEHSCDVEVSYIEKWQIRHWRAITSAYRNSPYFEYFEDEIKALYATEFKKLIDLNTAQLKLVLKLLKQPGEISLTTRFEKLPANTLDSRELIHPKTDFENDPNVVLTLNRPYYQTFGNKFAFAPNLSILDLLFNTGIGALDYLRQS